MQLQNGPADLATPSLGEDAARAMAERIAFAANALPALIAYVDTEVRYRWANEGYRRWFGIDPDEIIGRHGREVVGDAAWTVVEPYVKRALAGEAVDFDNKLESDGPNPRDVRVSYVPHRDGGGKPRGFVVLVTDISEMKAAEAAMRRSERILEQSQVAAQVGSWDLIFDEEQREIPGSSLWSGETYRILGLDSGTPATLAVFQGRVHPDDRGPLHARSLLGIARAERVETEYRIVRPDGEVRFIRAWLHFEREADGKTRASGTCQDITERKRAERERERALYELQETDRRKDEFLAMLSHELRNPLAPILNAAEILERLDPAAGYQASTYHTIIARQARHMKRLLDDLLDVSRVSQGKIQLQRERVELSALLHQALEVSRPLITERQHALTLALAPQAVVLDADPTRLVQVFANLINNAAKYTDPGGQITLTSVVENSEAVVTIRDDGVGMTPELLTRAFDLFVQGTHSLDRAQGGLGIGLTLTRTLVKMHGGSVQAFSPGLGRGSELVVKLPIARSTAASQAPCEEPSTPLRVLIVDDNVDATQALGHLVRFLGHEVSLAHNGPAALAAAVATPPDLVLLDIGLPGMDGYAVAARLRADVHPRPTLVALTGYGREEDLRRSHEAGFDHHLVKPVDFGQLRRISAELRRRRS